MKCAIVVLLLATNAAAGPYFRLIDPEHVQRSAGAYVDPVNSGNTSAGTATALITHSVRDGGCLLPAVVCEDWSPLTVGFSVRAGHLDFNLGPVVNLTPLVKSGLLATLNVLTRDEVLSGVKSALGSESLDKSTPSIAFGPNLGVAPIQNGGVLSPLKWQGKFRIFAGAAWAF